MPSNRRNKDVPGLFDGVSTPRLRSSPASPEQQRLLLPGDLSAALKHLDDGQLDTLLETVTAEAERRGRLPAGKQRKPVAGKNPEPVQVPHGKANVIRAALKAGVKPRAIARQLGVPLSTVQQVLKENRGGQAHVQSLGIAPPRHVMLSLTAYCCMTRICRLGNPG